MAKIVAKSNRVLIEVADIPTIIQYTAFLMAHRQDLSIAAATDLATQIIEESYRAMFRHNMDVQQTSRLSES